MKISSLRLNKLTVVAAEEILTNIGIAKIKVVSASMSPFIEKGDTIIFKSKRLCRAPKFGEIVLCRQKYNGSLLIHRYLLSYRKEGKLYYITKADQGVILDYPVLEEKLLGIEENTKKKNILNKLIIIYSALFFPLFFCITKIKLKDWKL